MLPLRDFAKVGCEHRSNFLKVCIPELLECSGLRETFLCYRVHTIFFITGMDAPSNQVPAYNNAEEEEEEAEADGEAPGPDAGA